MIGLVNLQKRIERLEPVPDPQPDIVGIVLGSLKDSDLDLLHEMAILRETGFDDMQIALMMADRHKKAMKAVEVFQERYQAIQEQMKPKPRPKKPARVRSPLQV
jgi:hypothetical protein